MKNIKAKIKVSETEIKNRLKNKSLDIKRGNKKDYGFFIGFVQSMLENEEGIILSKRRISEILTFYKVGERTYLEIKAKQLIDFSIKDLYIIVETIKNNTKVYATESYDDILKQIYLDFDLIKKEDFKSKYKIDDIVTYDNGEVEYTGKILSIKWNKSTCEYSYFTTFSQFFFENFREIKEGELLKK